MDISSTFFPNSKTHPQNAQTSSTEQTLQQPNIPYSHLIFNPKKDVRKAVKHCKDVFESIYLISRLSQSTKNKIHEKALSKAVMLKPKAEDNKSKKTLFIDLDQTLIHTTQKISDGLTEKIYINNEEALFNLRPYALCFLINMAQIFQLVLFTAANRPYAEAFFMYLNDRTNGSLSQLLCRDDCIHVYKTLFFKDLRIISNRQLRDMILLDNSAHSFGCLVNNGVPISAFTDEHNDLQLLYLQPYLRKLSQVDDVRQHNKTELDLMSILKVVQVSS